MPPDVAAIEQIPVFAGIPAADLMSLIELADEMQLGAGESLFLADQPADAFYVLVSGGVDLYSRGTRSDERFLAHLGPGAIIGETSPLMDGQIGRAHV